MKRILIVMHAMEIGGAEKALLGLLENMDYTKYSVDLFLLRHQGEWLKYIPKEVNLLPESASYSCIAVPIKEVFKKGKIRIAWQRYLGKKNARSRVKELGVSKDNGIGIEFSHKYTVKCMPMISDREYDAAISFLTPHYFVRDKVKAKKKIAWIHTDYSKVAIDKESELPMWAAFDDIVAVSDGVKEQFVKIFPTLAEKVTVIENILPVQLIQKQAKEPTDIPFSQENINLLSIGRFGNAKNFDNIPEICKRVKEEVSNVRWYIIGYGPDEALIRQKIEEYGMQDTVLILGKKENPYPYIQACDIYAQPSRYEGKAVTVKEAQMLGKPVVITDYATAKSQLTDGVDGVIVPMDNEGCAEGIIRLLHNPGKMKQLEYICRSKNYTNTEEIVKIKKLLN